MSNHVIVRDAASDEADVVGSLLRRSFPPEWLVSSIYSHPWGDRRLAEILSSEPSQRASRIRIASLNGSAVGCTVVDPVAGHLDYIAVLPELNGGGIGGLLLADAESSAPGPLSLDVFADNEAARGWYRRHRYEDNGGRRSVTVLDVAALVGATAPVGSAPGEKDVAVHGFAPARAVGDACSVDVVLYGEDRLRVRSWDGADLLHALSLVSSTWSTRPVVCLLDVDARSTASLVRWEGTLVRMVRSSRDA